MSNIEEIKYTNKGDYIYEYANMGESEFFSNSLYMYDFTPFLNKDVLTYIHKENSERKDEFNSEYKNTPYYIRRDNKNLSLQAVISTGLFADEIDVKQLSRSINQITKLRYFMFDIVELDEIYINIYYRERNSGIYSYEESIANAKELFAKEEYNTLSRINLDIIDVINLVDKYAFDDSYSDEDYDTEDIFMEEFNYEDQN